jgi:hypothetical protein
MLRKTKDEAENLAHLIEWVILTVPETPDPEWNAVWTSVGIDVVGES